MYRALFSFVVLGFLNVCGQYLQSPCPNYFEYRNDGNGLYGSIKLQPFGLVPSLLVRANFTIATRLPSAYYAGSIHPVGSELKLLQEFNRGVPLEYRVKFPITYPVPILTGITVNDNVICYGAEDPVGQAKFVTTISLQHMLFFRSSVNGMFPVNSQTYNSRPEEATRKPDIPNRPSTEPPTTTTIRTTTLRSTTPRPQPVYQPSTQECGISVKNDPNELGIAMIVKGMTFERGEWPWLVAIYKRHSYSLSYICAGTLVSDLHVITAAHCMRQRKSYTEIQDIVIMAGAHSLADWSTITVNRDLATASIHKFYNASTLANDLLVMTLSKTITFSRHIKPAHLWNGTTDLKYIVGRSAIVAGWGANEMGPEGEPRMFKMPIVSTETCRASKLEFHKLTSSKTLCAGDPGSVPCLVGWTGSGLYIHHDGRWRLRGVISLSLLPEDKSTCNLNDYIVFTDIAQYLPWIDTIISTRQ